MNIQIPFYTYAHTSTHKHTQYKKIHTKLIHLVHKVGVGMSQDDISISSNQCLTEMTIEIS